MIKIPESAACIGEDGIELKVGEDKVTEKDKGQKYLQRFITSFDFQISVIITGKLQVLPHGKLSGLSSLPMWRR